MLVKKFISRINQKLSRMMAAGLAVVILFTSILGLNSTAFAGTVKSIDLGVAEYFGLVAADTVTVYSDCPSSVMTKNLYSYSDIGNGVGSHGSNDADRTYGILYVTGDCYIGTQCHTALLMCNSAYSVTVNGGQKFLNNAETGSSKYIGTTAQCENFININSKDDNTGINLNAVISSMKNLSKELLKNSDNGITAIGNQGNDKIVYFEEGVNAVINVDKSWSGCKINVKSAKNNTLKNVNSTLLINVNLDDTVSAYSLAQILAGYSDFDNTDALVINFGDYSGTIYASTTCGTILAPNATVNLVAGNHNGRIIADNINVGAEVHFKIDYQAPKQETTTTAPQEETTTAPKEETTTAPKEETTTAPKEETTTAPQRETTTTAPQRETTTTVPQEETTTASQGEKITTTLQEEYTTTSREEETTTVVPENENTTTVVNEEETTTAAPEDEIIINLDDEEIPLAEKTTTANPDDPEEKSSDEEVIIMDDEIPLASGIPVLGDTANLIYLAAIAVGMAIVVVVMKKSKKNA